MKHLPLDIYDDMPEAMKRYIQHFGFHFNKKAFEYAVNSMKKKDGKVIDAWTKEQCDQMLQRYGVQLEHNTLYDAAYVMNMAKADYLRSSITDEAHIALYVKDVLDDPDGSDELPFRCWMQKCIAMGTPVEFEDLM